MTLKRLLNSVFVLLALATVGLVARHFARTGWPLHRANLEGCVGRNKRWDYWAVLAGDIVVSLVYANIDYAGLAHPM